MLLRASFVLGGSKNYFLNGKPFGRRARDEVPRGNRRRLPSRLLRTASSANRGHFATRHDLRTILVCLHANRRAQTAHCLSVPATKCSLMRKYFCRRLRGVDRAPQRTDAPCSAPRLVRSRKLVIGEIGGQHWALRRHAGAFTRVRVGAHAARPLRSGATYLEGPVATLRDGQPLNAGPGGTRYTSNGCTAPISARQFEQRALDALPRRAWGRNGVRTGRR